MANEAEQKRWNDPYWSAVWPRREALTDHVTEDLLDALSLRPGERVLDVGSGGGSATLEAARRVAPAGSVIGADISAPLVAFATARAGAGGVTNARFDVVDVQIDPVTDGPFDVVMSQFGVMFFDEPAKAFANVAAHLDHGGRLGFSCWRAMAENPWFVGYALAGLVPPPAPPAPGKAPTGPFALADQGHIEGLLLGAGFSDVNCRPVTTTRQVPRSALVDHEQLVFVGVPAERMAEAAEAVERHLASFADGSGSYVVPLAYWIVTASRG